MPSFQEVKASYAPSDIYLLDRKGNELQRVRKDFTRRRLQWTELKDISPAFIEAVIISEDKRFYEHNGVDWRAAVSALFDNLTGRSRRGASTITMQLSGLIDKDYIPVKRSRDLHRKWDQAMRAIEIERLWNKQEVLEAYLNLLSFKGEIQGIGTASRVFFGKDPKGLNKLESAVLAVLIRQPEASQEAVIIRTKRLMKAMGGDLQESEIAMVVDRVFSATSAINKGGLNLAPHITRYLDVGHGDKVQTTIDRDVQLYSADALRRALVSLRGFNVSDGAILVVNNRTGEVLAYVGNGGDMSSAHLVDGVRARRQAGSTLKPFLYALAIEKRLLTPSSIIEDSPVSISTERGFYMPRNYSEDYKGFVTVREALASSLNAPAVKALMLVGIDDFYNKLRMLGITLPEGADYYGYAIALGSVDVSLYEITNAYRAISQGGVLSPLHIQSKSAGKRGRVFSEESAFIISDILSDRSARGLTFGLENPLSTRFWTAVKTGTSKDMRDNWCIGFSSSYTVGVWVGNFSGSPMWNVSGVSGAAQVWLEVINYLHRNRASYAPVIPDGVVMKDVFLDESGTKNRKEWFIRKDISRQQELSVPVPTSLNPRILYPVEGALFALDPDIPEGLQRLYFEVSAPARGMRMVIGGETFKVEERYVLWKPRQGRHRAMLVDSSGKVLEEVGFEVRGGGIQ